MKKICKLLVIATVAFVLTGCMKMRTTVIIEDEKTASMVMDILLSKEMMDSYKMDIDDLKKQFSSGDYKNSKTKEIEETIDGEEYQGVSVTVPDKEIDKILDELTVRDVDGKKEYTLALTKEAIGEKMDPSAIGGAQYSIKQMKDAGGEMTMTIQMPGKITDATFGKVKGNTITIDLLDMAKNTDTIATVTSLEGGSSNAIYLYAAIGVGVVALLAIAGILIIKKRKNRIIDEPVVIIDEPVEITSETIAPTTKAEESMVEETVATDTTEVIEDSGNSEETTTQQTDTIEEVTTNDSDTSNEESDK